MEQNPLVIQLKTIQRHFNKVISVLSEEDSAFKPEDGAMTVAQQVRHVTMTIDWFNDGTFSGKGFAMNFEEMLQKYFEAESLEAEKAEFDKAINRSIEIWSQKSMEELNLPIENDNIMGGAPKISSLYGIMDHTAHHRGSLATYSRIIGKIAPMPYE